MKKQGELIRSIKRRSPGGKVLCTALAITMLLSQTASAAPWRVSRNQILFDNELGIKGFCILRFATETGSYIRPITKLYGTKISLKEYVPTREGYTFEGWFSDPRTKQNQVTEFTFNQNDVVYAKWNKINNEISIDEIMQKDQIYLTDEEQKIRTEYIKEQNKAYIDGFGYVAPSKTNTIIVDSDGDINKMVGSME